MLIRSLGFRSAYGRLLIKMALFLLPACAWFSCIALAENVYVIAGEPYPARVSATYPTILYRLEKEGLTWVRTITTAKQGAIFVHPFHDKGYVFVGSIGARKGTYLVDVLDLDSVNEERTFDLDGCIDWTYRTSHLLHREGRLIYMIRSTDPNRRLDFTRACRIVGVDIRTGDMVNGLDESDLKYAYAYGSPGGVAKGGDFGEPISEQDGHATLGLGGMRSDLGWELPPGLDLRGGYSVRLSLDNDFMRVTSMRLSDSPPPLVPAARNLRVFDKASRQWVTLSLPGSGFPAETVRDYWSGLEQFGEIYPMRAYRDWLAAEEVNVYSEDNLDLEPLKTQRFPPFLSAAERFQERRVAPTGRFRLYNVRSKEIIVHDTGEPNSEVLYVDENDVVYYRVSDELRLAQIEGGKLVQSRVLVKLPEMWAVHWLFLGNE